MVSRSTGSSLEISEEDKRLLEALQEGIPLEPRPFKRLGKRLGMEEGEVLERVKRLKEKGIIRRLGGVFNSRKMGFVGVLCAAKVPEYKIQQFVEVVNSFPQVTHNYYRKALYNIWFTITAESRGKVNKIVKEIEEKTGIEVRTFPATKVYKLRVVFPFD